MDKRHRQQLNDNQLELLTILNKFRFSTKHLISDYYNKTKPGTDIHRRLTVLEDLKLIDKRYEPRYRLIGKPATYFLTSKGVRALSKSEDSASPKDLDIKAAYRNKTVGEPFIDHCLGVFSAYNILSGYKDIKLFTKYELAAYDYFPDPRPDLYIRLADKQYWLELCASGQPLAAHIAKIKRYIEYASSGNWEATNTNLPTVLLLCDSSALRNRLRKIATKLTNDSWDTEIAFALGEIKSLTNGNEKIWQLADDPDECIKL